MSEAIAVYRIQKAELEKPERYYLEVNSDGDFGAEIYGDRAGLIYLRDSLSELLETPDDLGRHIHLLLVNRAGEVTPDELLVEIMGKE